VSPTAPQAPIPLGKAVKSLPELLAEKILEDIMSGRLPAGERAALLAIAARNCALDPAAPRAKLAELTDEMERLAADPDTPAPTFSERSVAAQTLLINASGNGRLPALYDHLSDISSWRMIRGRATSFLKAERRREAARDWRAIERAISTGDAGAAEAGARLLFTHSSAAVRAELQGAE